MRLRRSARTTPAVVSTDSVVATARRLFVQRSVAHVTLADVAAEMGAPIQSITAVFPTITDLFEAVFLVVAEQFSREAGEALTATDPVALLHQGAVASLDLLAEREALEIMILQAPGALGWHRWRALGGQFGSRVIEAGLADAMDKGAIPDQPVRAMGMAIAGLLESAAFYVATQSDPVRAREEMMVVLDNILAALTSTASRAPQP